MSIQEHTLSMIERNASTPLICGRSLLIKDLTWVRQLMSRPNARDTVNVERLSMLAARLERAIMKTR